MRVKRIAVLHTGLIEHDAASAQRIVTAAVRLGIETQLFEKSEDIPAFKPDFVIAVSVQDPKLTAFPTYGLIDSVPARYGRTRRFIRNICSYDAYLTPSAEVRQWLRDLCFGAHKLDAPAAFFGRTAPMSDFHTEIGRESVAAYHLDPATIQTLRNPLATLSRTGLVQFFGDKQHARGLASRAYRGPVTPDGAASIQRYREAGIGLALGIRPQRAAGLPPESLFEIIAGGAVAICDRSSWIEKAFGASVLYIDGDRSDDAIAAEIAERVRWVRANPEVARRMAFEAHAVMQKHYTTERLLLNIVEMHPAVLSAKGYAAARDHDDAALPSVSYIMRTGGKRPMHMTRRALDGLVAQNYPQLTVIFVLFAPFPELDDVMRDYPTLSYKVVSGPGAMRSTGIIQGVRAVETDLFGLHDDDDELHPNHIRTLVKTLRHHDQRDLRGPIGVVYASSVEVTNDGHRAEKAEWHDQLMPPREQRHCIEHFRWYTTSLMAEYKFFMHSNAWLARKSIVNDDVLDDPLIDTCEDLYFEIQLAQRARFAFSCEVTAIHHFHGHAQSTIVDSARHWSDTQHMALRAWQRVFPAETVYINPSYSMPLDGPHGIQPDTNFLPRMSIGGGAERRGDLVRVTRSTPSGVALFGPYVTMPPGDYRLSVFIEVSSPGRWLGRALRLEVAYDTGRRIATRMNVKALPLRFGRHHRLDMRFSVSEELADQPLEFRVWRRAPMALDIVRIVVTPA
jgi:hypothetical protein